MALMVLVKSRRVQLEAMHSSKQSDVEKGLAGEKNKCGRIPRSLLEQRFRELNGFEARPAHAFEHPVGAEHSQTVMSRAMCDKSIASAMF